MSKRLTVLAIFLATTLPLSAWDTLVEEGALSWKSVYIGVGFENHNEHTALADRALKELGLSGFGASELLGFEELSITDLNASLFRRELMDLDKSFDDSGTLLEERSLARPAHFAGLPDYSHTVYDWINKNHLCPVLPEGAERPDLCHEFVGWMGALNSSHFGTQARLMYEYYHQIALALAERARVMREDKFGDDLFGGPAGEYEDYVKEAEQEALIYESFAQHFLQDRWSMGHMWERWNSPDYEQLADKSILFSGEVAAASGLIHGAQAIFLNFEPLVEPLDPLCSPVLVEAAFGFEGSAQPVRWMTTTAVSNEKGVGDYRTNDMFNDTITRDGVTYDLFVSKQLENLMQLSKAGWAEAVKALGQNDAGFYGIYGVGLDESGLPAQGTATEHLWDAWATNEAMDIGFNRGWVEDLASLVRFAINLADDNLVRVRPCWVALKWQIWRGNRPSRNPANTTDLARGGMGTFGLTFPGNIYALADYVEPEDFSTLPDSADEYVSGRGNNRPGRDKQSIYGFFNRAHTDYWCENMESRLGELRGSDEALDQAVCEYLADRVYKGTDPDYGGAQLELRTYLGAEANPVCFYYDVQEESYREELPYYIHPGYVNKGEPDARAESDYTHQSVANWCAKVPVVNLLTDASGQLSAEDRVGNFSGQDDERTVELTGLNFGDDAGKVLIDGQAVAAELIASWSDTSITLHFPESTYPAEVDYDLSIETAEGKSSVGRFILTQPFLEIVDVEYPTELLSDAGSQDMTVTWTGNPTFPVTIIVRIDQEDCPEEFTCVNVQGNFVEEENPLVVSNAVGCALIPEPVVVAYEVIMIDANGLESNVVATPYTCLPP